MISFPLVFHYFNTGSFIFDSTRSVDYLRSFKSIHFRFDVTLDYSFCIPFDSYAFVSIRHECIRQDRILNHSFHITLAPEDSFSIHLYYQVFKEYISLILSLTVGKFKLGGKSNRNQVNDNGQKVR